MKRTTKRTAINTIIAVLTMGVILLLLYTRYLSMIATNQMIAVKKAEQQVQIERIERFNSTIVHAEKMMAKQDTIDSLQCVVDSLTYYRGRR